MLKRTIVSASPPEAAAEAPTLRERLFEHIPVPVFVSTVPLPDMLPNIVDCNPAACAATGYTRAELIGQPLALVSGPALDGAERQATAAMHARGEPVRFRSLLRHKGGAITPVEVSASSFDGADRPLTVTVIQALSPGDTTLERGEQAPASSGAELSTWDWETTSADAEPQLRTPRPLGTPVPEDEPFVREAVAYALRTGTACRVEFRAHDAQGRLHWLEGRGVPYYGEPGLPAQLFGTLMDITERRRAEEELQRHNAELELRVSERTLELELTNRALRYEIADREHAEAVLYERERFLERVMAATPSQVYVFDIVQPSTIYTNHGFEGLGYSPAEQRELGPLAIIALMHPDDRARLPEIFERQRHMADEEVLDNEFRVRHRDGSWRWLATRDVVFARGPDGTPVQLLGVALDITAIKQAQAEHADNLRWIAALNDDLRRSRDLLGSIVDSLDDGLALISSHGSIMLANRSLAAIYGLPLGRIAGRPWAELCPVTTPLIERTFQERAATAGRREIRRGDGSSLMIDLNTFPLLSEAGPVEQIVIHVVDVTERLQLEALALENERLTVTGRLAATVAHEVNSPLQSIQNFLYLSSYGDAEEHVDYLALISDEIDRIGGLIRRLLDLNRPGDGAQKPVDLNELIRRVLALTAGTMARHHVTVSHEPAAARPIVLGRADQLTQVLLNLFLNAIDAMPHGGKLIVTTREEPGRAEGAEGAQAAEQVVIEVRDTGDGIAPEALTKIFTPFYTTKANGSGIGLAISHQIVEQHGGRLSAANADGGGAVFRVALPKGDLG